MSVRLPGWLLLFPTGAFALGFTYGPYTYPYSADAPALVIFGCFLSLLAALALGAATLCVWKEHLTLPLPCKKRRLEKRLHALEETAHEIQRAIEAAPGSVHAENFRGRLIEIDGAREVLKTELVYEELRRLDRKAHRQIRKELG